jgi:hypothetical protein
VQQTATRPDFDSQRFRELFEEMSWASIDEIVEAVENDGSVVADSFRAKVYENALKSRIRRELQREDEETGDAIGVSIIAEDGDKRYKSPKLFDDSDYRQRRNHLYDTIVTACKKLRQCEHRGHLADQLSLDFTWVVEG